MQTPNLAIIDAIKTVHEFCEKQQYCHKCPLLTVCGADAPEYWHMNELSHAERNIINENNI